MIYVISFPFKKNIVIKVQDSFTLSDAQTFVCLAQRDYCED